MLGRFWSAAVGAFGVLLVWQAGWLSEPRSYYTLTHVAELALLGAIIVLAFYQALRPKP